MKRLTHVLAVCAVCALPSLAGAGQQGAGDAADQFAQLVKQLGDESYASRSQAANALAAAGLRAKPALLEGLRHPDLEVRLRSHQLLIRVMRSDFESQLSAFIDNDQAQPPPDLAGWKKFRALVGDSRPTRRLFAEMIREESSVLEAFDSDNSEFQRIYSDRLRALQGRTFSTVQRELNVGSLATMLFVGTDGETNLGTLVSSQMLSLLNSESGKRTVLHGGHAKPMLELLRSWVLRHDEGTQAYYALTVTLNYGLSEPGLDLARKVLQKTGPSPIAVQYAAITLGRFGGAPDVQLLDKHLGNRSVCHTWTNPQLKKGIIRIEVRDVVLAMSIHLAGKKPRDFGFDLLRDDPTTMYKVYTFGFLEEKEREAAFKKWAEFKEAG